MSLPSVAVYYDVHNNELYRYPINVGWSLHKRGWVKCVVDLPKIYKSHIVQVYGIKVPAKWTGTKRYECLLNKLFQELYETGDKDITGIKYFNKIYGRNWYNVHKIKQANNVVDDGHQQLGRILLPIIRKIAPSVIAEEIVGIQPMTDDIGLVWSIRTSYSSKYRIINSIKQYWEKIKHECNKKIIYINSIFG